MRDWPAAPLPLFRKAVFLDRDGTINEDTHYPYRLEDLRFIPGSLEAIAQLSQVPVHIIVVANQAGIAKGLFSEREMARFNSAMLRATEAEGGRIDAFYYCPHLERKDLPEGQATCACSKPSAGLLWEAAADYQLDLRRCYMVGDRASDVAAGFAAGCETVLVLTGKGGRGEEDLPVRPQHTVENLREAARILLSHLGIGTGAL